MNEIIENLNKLEKNENIIKFRSGDTICVNFNIIDNKYKNRNQTFEGIVIAIKNNGKNSTCTLRKISYGEGVEKTFFIHSPTINWIKIKKRAVVRKSKIYYIKKLANKTTKIKEKIN
jgi:large subunit ribosomal protein L19